MRFKYMGRTQGRRHGSALLLLLVLTLVLCTGLSAYAEGGDGSGSGGGSSVPLSMVSSVPADGASGVSTDATFTLQFSHNVADAGVSSGNLSHFSLATAAGEPVSVSAYVADVQIEFDKRRDIYVKPAAALQPGTEYVLTITPGVKAKNGMATQQTQTVRFTTAGTAPAASGSTENSGTSGSRVPENPSAPGGSQEGGQKPDNPAAAGADLQTPEETKGVSDPDGDPDGAGEADADADADDPEDLSEAEGERGASGDAAAETDSEEERYNRGDAAAAIFFCSVILFAAAALIWRFINRNRF